MNAPDPAVTAAAPPNSTVIAREPLGHFAPSTTNRAHNDKAYLQDLADSIKLHGVIQPITARPWPASRGAPPEGVVYEIVIGEGRWLASGLAQVADIPFFWRELNDEEALELQLIENLKRKNLTAVEEGEGYRRLMQDHGHTADTIAVQIGKSRAHVYAMLKLLDLCPAALKVFNEGGLTASTALLVARIPSPDLQAKAAKEISTGGPYSGDRDPMSYRRAAEYVQSNYMLRLGDAPFSRSDAELLPAAGACGACPKRTGNQSDLFADVKSADVCTDPECFAAKKEAHVARQKAQAKADGRKIIEGAEAKKLKPNSYSDDLSGGYVDLDKKVWQDGKHVSVRQLLGKDAPPADLLIDPHHKGTVIEVVSKATVEEKLAAKGKDIPSDIRRQSRNAEEKEAQRKQKQEATWRQRLYDRIRSQIAVDFDTRAEDSVLDLREFQLITLALLERTGFDELKRLARVWIGPTEKTDDHALIGQLKEQAAKMDRKDCARLMIECALIGQVTVPSYSSAPPRKLLETAAAMGIDAGEIKKTVIAEMRAKEKTKTVKKAEKPAPAAKVQPDTAKPATKPVTKPGDLAAHLIYCHPNDPTVTWSGKGQQPAWVKALLASGGGLDVRDRNEAAKPASTPIDAARAGDKGATAAPAEAKPAKKPAAKKAKAKADPAPASPANEAAAPPKPSALHPMAAWPFPMGNRP